MSGEVDLKDLEQRAIAGEAKAQMEWAMCCFDGQGVPQDPEKAVEWLEKASAQGNHDAQYFLAICYESGEGVPADPEKAKEYYAMCGMV